MTNQPTGPLDPQNRRAGWAFAMSRAADRASGIWEVIAWRAVTWWWVAVGFVGFWALIALVAWLFPPQGWPWR